ncbi:DUF2997 domain-containing protein [Anaerolinea thermophila]|uniref:DUF2997 domain-containing protein n=3 Tax=Anaerolinea TaxID=233189 RepID=E8N5G2_ANATU|nr:DUF2997 domain-containing protein [Anaerolinea thermophila]BAJ63676.1 hypothetical protein ANT_16500 [Anaerolinea thermophila UNI-1]
MEIQEIEVVILPDGKVEVRVRGVKGQACLELTAEMEKALGGTILLREMTPEAQEPPTAIDQSDTLSLSQ